jgi:hypothetical protein
LDLYVLFYSGQSEGPIARFFVFYLGLMLLIGYFRCSGSYNYNCAFGRKNEKNGVFFSSFFSSFFCPVKNQVHKPAMHPTTPQQL